MAKTEKRTDTVRTEAFRKVVRVPIDAEATEKREIQATKIQLSIRKLQKKIKPELEKITAHRAEHRTLLEDIESGTTEQEAEVYEVKNFRRQEAVMYLVDGDVEVGRRTLEKADNNTDLTETAAEAAE